MLKPRTLAALAVAVFATGTVPLMYSCRTTQTAGSQMSDAEITTKVKSKFMADADVKAIDVSVTTEEGVVYLTGRVENEMQRDKAVRIAENTAGVKKVVDHIKVGDRT